METLRRRKGVLGNDMVLTQAVSRGLEKPGTQTLQVDSRAAGVMLGMDDRMRRKMEKQHVSVVFIPGKDQWTVRITGLLQKPMEKSDSPKMMYEAMVFNAKQHLLGRGASEVSADDLAHAVANFFQTLPKGIQQEMLESGFGPGSLYADAG